MIHLGDITQINGAEIPPVDVITGGSPCQDLSVAGKREGLDGERSGLFMEQLRVVKEMREHDRSNGRTGEFIRPRYMVWENVPGAFSSGKPKGSDFQAVLTEIVKIVQPDCPDVPLPKKGWSKSGCIYDELGKWSIAWRVHDAQFWGVPQRRKRIALVADFAGRSAPEILFERKGLQGNFEKSEGEEQATSEGVGRSIEQSDRGECLNPFDHQAKHIQPENGIADTLYAGECRYGGGESYVMKKDDKCLNSWDIQCKHIQPENGIAESLYSGQSSFTGGESYVMKDETIAIEGNGSRPSHHGDGYRKSDKMYSLNTTETHAVCSYQERAGKPGGGKGILKQEDHVGALQTHSNQLVIKDEVSDDRTPPE